MPPSGDGETRAVYVVQRHFRRVRRGYDPDEVDRHLQLVSQWFAEHRVGELARELQARLQEREEAVVEAEQDARRLLEGASMEAEGMLEGAGLRAAAEAKDAERTRARAAADLARRDRDADAKLADAGRAADELRATARAQAAAIG